MTESNDVIRGAIKLDNFMEGLCFESFDAFIKALPSMLTVELPAGITNVTSSSQQPGDDERDHLWVRLDGSGSFLGLFVYAQGAWQQVYPPPNVLYLVYGDSRVIPTGYQLASDSPNLTSAQITALKGSWLIGGTSPVWYSLFHVV